MSLFPLLYGQVICCSCPGGLEISDKCANKTGIHTSNPITYKGSYAWIISTIVFIALWLLSAMITVYCCRKHR